jgi:hypothetical protein
LGPGLPRPTKSSMASTALFQCAHYENANDKA